MGEGHGGACLPGALRGIQEIRVQGSQVLAGTWPGLTSDWMRLLVPSPVMGILSKLNKLESEAAVTVGAPASGSVELPASPGSGGKGSPRILDMEPASHCFQAEDSFYQMKSQAEHQHIKLL